MRCDFHTHSTASDGLLSPAELVQAAYDAGLQCIALADHDSIDGVREAQMAGNHLGIEVIAAAELNTELPNSGSEAHVLGYFLPIDNVQLAKQLLNRRESRVRRAQKMVEQLQRYSIDITFAEVQAKAQGAIGRPHVAAVLVDRGVAEDVADAFDRFLSPGLPGYVAREPFTPIAAIQLIRSFGGVPSLAHPLYILNLDILLPQLVAVGLQGLEVFYGQYTKQQESLLIGLCKTYDLIPTGGSDYHGPNMHPTKLGEHKVPETTLVRLRQQHQQNILNVPAME